MRHAHPSRARRRTPSPEIIITGTRANGHEIQVSTVRNRSEVDHALAECLRTRPRLNMFAARRGSEVLGTAARLDPVPVRQRTAVDPLG